jgi:hypothetical protein
MVAARNDRRSRYITGSRSSLWHSEIEELQISTGLAMPKEECKEMQEDCQDKVCGKIDTLGETVGKTIDNNTKKWQQVATILGAICQKLHIPLPDWK